MYPIPQNETLLQTKTCRHCQTSFPITDKDLEFYEKVSPVFPLNRHSELVSESSAFPSNKEDPGSSPGWRHIKIEWNKVRYLIPTPTLCPDCRQQRRLSFRNERKLYKRKCDATGRDIISIYSPDKPYKVYHQDFWWSDKWDPMKYGRDFDFGRSFFEQFGELMGKVPRIASPNKNSSNCDYSNIAANSKDCYLSNTVHHSENILYSGWIISSSDSVDCSRSTSITDSYQLVNCYGCSQSYFSQDSRNCNNIQYSYNLDGCSHCFLCSNLKNQSYCIENKAYTKNEYVYELEKLVLKGQMELMQDFSKLVKSTIHKENNNMNTESSRGNNLVNCKNCQECFDAVWWEDCKYCIEAAWIETDCMDCSYMGWWDTLTLTYESISVVGNESHFSSWTWYNDKVMFVDFCLNSSHLFWCIGLRNKSYCILNKQYAKEEYEILVPRIIEHMQATWEWWEFFPSSLSPFGYNETVAMEYYPLTRDQISEGRDQNGKNIFNWSDYEAPFPKVEKIIPADKLPDDIAKIPDDILNWAIECEVTKKPFRIIKQELEFYRKHNLPIPRRHPDQRHLDRMALRNPRKLFERKCDKCGVEMVTTYAPERKEIVYCEKCYEEEVV